MLKLAVFPRIFVYVVVWFYPRFKFYIPLFLSMLIYHNNFKTEEIIFKQRKKWIWTNALCCFRDTSEMVTGNQGFVVVAQYVACSRRSDSRAREKNSRRKKTRGGPALVWSFRSVRPKCPFPFDKIVLPSTVLLYPTYKNINQTRWIGSSLCNRNARFQTGIFVEWKVPRDGFHSYSAQGPVSRKSR